MRTQVSRRSFLIILITKRTVGLLPDGRHLFLGIFSVLPKTFGFCECLLSLVDSFGTVGMKSKVDTSAAIRNMDDVNACPVSS